MTENTRGSIIVPTDFSPVAESAIAHACSIAGKTGDEICLLHIINKESKAGLKKQNAGTALLSEKLAQMCERYSAQHQLVFKYVLKEGSIFTTIGETADEIGASLLVMGTHGVIGMQHVVGAYALKVVASCKAPVIIVQSKPPGENGYCNIVSPVDASIETKQKTLHTISIARAFGSKVYLFKQKSTDDYMEDITRLNLNFIMRYLNDHDIACEVVEQRKTGNSFAADFMAYSTQINAGLIIILTTVDKTLKDFILGPVEQEVINNSEQIPVMCINPLQHLYK